jgi:hypothetical protein
MIGFLIAGILAVIFVLYLLIYEAKGEKLLKFIATVLFILFMFVYAFMAGYIFGQKDAEIGIKEIPMLLVDDTPQFKDWRIK